MTEAVKKPSMGRQALRLLAGAVAGAGSTIAFMELVGKSRLDSGDPGTIVALIAGLIYALMGVFVGLGALAPRPGAVFLNVEDADEIREQRASLAPSAIACILVGAFLLLLALAPVEQNADLSLWLFAAAACLLGVLAVSLATRGRTDELMRQVSLESSALTLHVALAVLSGWAMLAQFGYAAWLTPLSLIAGLALLYLVAIFWLAGKKGMLKPR
jgi:hypothetical protein